MHSRHSADVDKGWHSVLRNPLGGADLANTWKWEEICMEHGWEGSMQSQLPQGNERRLNREKVERSPRLGCKMTVSNNKMAYFV